MTQWWTLPRIAGGLLAVLGLVLTVIGAHEAMLSAGASATPEVLTLRELIRRGPEGNPHVIVTDLEYCDNYVYEFSRTRRGRGGRMAGRMREHWHQVWIPVVPASGASDGLHDAINDEQIQAIVKSARLRNPLDLERLADEPRLHAMVTNRVDSLADDELDLLMESYPDTDFSKCLIIQHGIKPVDKQQTMFFLGGGVFLLVAGVGLVLFGGNRQQGDSAGFNQIESS